MAAVILLKKDFGPMKAAEEAYMASATGNVSADADEVDGDPA